MSDKTGEKTARDCGRLIVPRLAAIMADVKAIGKAGRNTQQNYDFRKIEDVVDMLHPLFAKHGCYILPEVVEERSEDRQSQRGANLIYRVMKVRVHFVCGEDGSRQTAIVMGEGMDSGDKASNKAMTAALKYALSQTFLLPYGLVDGDASSPPESAPAKQDAPPSLEEQLLERMAADCISNIGMIRYCQGKRFLPEGDQVRLADLPPQVTGKMLLPENWAKVKDAIAAQPQPAAQGSRKPVPPVKSDQNAFNTELYTLMELSGVTKEELKKYLLGKGYITDGQTIDNLPETFVSKMIETVNWAKVTAAIKEARAK